MGIFRKKKLSLLSGLIAFFCLSGCAAYESSSLNPETIRTVFNNVNNAFASMNIDKNNYNSSFGYGYDEIFELYNSTDKQGNTPYDIRYDDEPLIELYYLKGIIDKVDDDLSYGTIYYDVIPSNVYFDIKTGIKDGYKKSDNKYYYVTLVAADVTCTKQGIIGGDMVLRNYYSKKQITSIEDSSNVLFETTKYVSFYINYDFSKESPSFILKLVSRNDERTAPYNRYINYQYDYFKFSQNALVEWREFSIDSCVELTMNDEYDSFDNYIDEEIAYRVNAPRWYVDGTYYKTENMDVEKENIIGNCLYNLGLFDKAIFINFAPQLQKLESNDFSDAVLLSAPDIYVSTSYLVGDDMQYALISKYNSNVSYINEENNPYKDPFDDEPKKIVFYENPGNKYAQNPYYIEDIQFLDLFIEFLEQNNNKLCYIKPYYANKSGEVLDEMSISKLVSSDCVFYFVPYKAGNMEEFIPITVTLNDYVSEAFKMFNAANDNSLYSSDFGGLIRFTIRDKSIRVNGDLYLKFIDDLSFLDQPPEFPQELSDLGVPSFDGPRVTKYSPTHKGDVVNYIYNIYTKDAHNEYCDYFNKLLSNGFMCSYYNDSYSSEDFSCYKSVDSHSDLVIRVWRRYNNCLAIKVYERLVSNLADSTTVFPQRYIDMGLPAYGSYNTSAYFDFYPNNTANMFEGDKDILLIYNISSSELDDFCSGLINLGFRNDEIYDEGFYYYTGAISNKYNMNIAIYYYDINETIFVLQFEKVLNPNYVDQIDINSLYFTTTFGSWDSSMANPNYKFEFYDNKKTMLLWQPNKILIPGKSFKFIANGDWSVSNSFTTYSGFGYDDVMNIDDYPDLFKKGSNGEVVVIDACRINYIVASIQGQNLFFSIYAESEDVL